MSASGCHLVSSRQLQLCRRHSARGCGESTAHPAGPSLEATGRAVETTHARAHAGSPHFQQIKVVRCSERLADRKRRVLQVFTGPGVEECTGLDLLGVGRRGGWTPTLNPRHACGGSGGSLTPDRDRDTHRDEAIDLAVRLATRPPRGLGLRRRCRSWRIPCHRDGAHRARGGRGGYGVTQ